MRVAIVGCGFLGSLFGLELAKRCYAFEEPLTLTLVDPDKVEARNAANQLYDPEWEGQFKVEALMAYLSLVGVRCRPLPKRFEDSGVEPGSFDLLVDAVDKLETRQLLWQLGASKKVPVLHLGATRAGTGVVEWTVGRYDNFSLSPLVLVEQGDRLVADRDDGVALLPCELAGFRGLGLMTALAGARAACLARGMDPEKAFDGVAVYTSWLTSTMGYQLREEKPVAAVADMNEAAEQAPPEA